MAISDPLTAADYGAGAAKVGAYGTQMDSERARAKADFDRAIKRSRRKQLTGDLAMIAAAVAPFALPALGKVLLAGTPGAAAGTTVAGATGGAGFGGAAGLAGGAGGIGGTAALPAAAAPATGIRAGIGQALMRASALQPYTAPLALGAGSLFGDPSEEGAGVASLLSGIGQRGEYESARRRVMRPSRAVDLFDEEMNYGR